MGARIVLLTNNSWDGCAISQRMVDGGCAPVMIVREEQSEKFNYSWPSRLARKIFGDAAVNRVVQLRQGRAVRATAAWEQRMQRASQEWLDQACGRIGLTPRWPDDIPHLITGKVNDPDIVERVRQEKPDLIVVFGTGLLRDPLLAIPKQGTLNAHSSLLPHYKGARSEFWQCYNDDPRHLGISIHVVDRLVDNGPIVFQCSTRSTWPSDQYRLRAANTMAILEHYPRVVKEFLAGRMVPVPQGTTEIRTYRKNDVTMETRVALMQRITG